MSLYTNFLKLLKPSESDKYNVNIFNGNADLIDSEFSRLNKKNESQDSLLATKESLHTEISRATTNENEIIRNLSSEINRAKETENSLSNAISNEVNRSIASENQIQESLSEHIINESNPHKVTVEQLNLENVDNTADIDKPVSTSQQNAIDSSTSNHNISETSHSDIRDLISDLTARLNALADSDDTTLDQLSEIVAYIKNNKSLIDAITTSKINVSDIIDGLDSTATNKVLSSNQGRVLKELITALTNTVDNKVDKVSGKGLSTNDYTTTEKNKLSGIASGAEANVQSDWNVTDTTSDAFIRNKPTSMPASDVPSWAKAEEKPTYSKSEIGLGNVENKSSETIREELTKENIINALGYTPSSENVSNDDFLLINQENLIFNDNVCTLTDERITADSLADVYFTSDTISIAEEAIISVETYDGNLKLNCQNPPTSQIKASITIRVV